jgi:branched-chain amino acid transport system permease protein
MNVLVIQILNGLSYATTLFLMASGLTLIFGVTRMVNFAHGSFFMLGALFAAHWVTDWFPAWSQSPGLYALAMLLGALVAALAGAVAELLLLRRMRSAPEIYQLVATFGLTLAMHDAMRFALGPAEVFAPRFPGLKGSLEIGGEFFPLWQCVILVLGPVVWWLLHLLLTRSLWGRRVRAATQDPEMLGAMGVNPAPLMLGVVILGCSLAGLAGALQLPREPANLQMDMNVVVETFVVVVTGGLGSVSGAFGAAVLIGLVHALGVSLWPQATLVLVFLTMAAVLIWRPEGLRGHSGLAPVREAIQVFRRVPTSPKAHAALGLLMWVCWWIAQSTGDYGQSLAEDTLILLLFGFSLQLMMALGGLVSFGHAAYFGLGAYGAALTHLKWGWSLFPALAAGVLCAGVVAGVFGALVLRSRGVYLAMLSLALAQTVWAGLTQWVALTGGDNGLIGLHLIAPNQRTAMGWGLVLMCFVVISGLSALSRSVWGMGLQAGRDAPQRAQASGLPLARWRYQVFVLSACVAGLAGGLWAAAKGAVFPSVASVSTSVDALLVILLGGLHHLWGAAVGSVLLTWAGAELGRQLAYWHGVLGVLIMLLMVLSPQGVLGWQWASRRPGQAGGVTS